MIVQRGLKINPNLFDNKELREKDNLYCLSDSEHNCPSEIKDKFENRERGQLWGKEFTVAVTLIMATIGLQTAWQYQFPSVKQKQVS
jgi:hypothetical protein